MHPGSGCNDGTLANGLLYRYPELANLPRSGIVHRLDKDTSGVLLVAKNEKFRNYFIKLMQERKIIKEYIAVVAGPTLGSFSIDYPIGRDRFNRTKMALRADGKDAITDVKLNQSFNNYSLLDVSIKTGRTHQIRVHLSSRKLPIIGDKTYDPAKTVTKGTSSELIEIIRSFPRQALHASLLSFECPDTKKKLSYEIPIPLDIKNLISSLKKHS
jgi:23S rRNA pseudouridine1911/1915/1917 synthase